MVTLNTLCFTGPVSYFAIDLKLDNEPAEFQYRRVATSFFSTKVPRYFRGKYSVIHKVKYEILIIDFRQAVVPGS